MICFHFYTLCNIIKMFSVKSEHLLIITTWLKDEIDIMILRIFNKLHVYNAANRIDLNLEIIIHPSLLARSQLRMKLNWYQMSNLRPTLRGCCDDKSHLEVVEGPELNWMWPKRRAHCRPERISFLTHVVVQKSIL